MTHPSLMPWGPGKPVRLTGGLRRVMIIEEIKGRAARCTWMVSGRMHSDWFCISGLVPAHAMTDRTQSPETRAKISATLKAKGIKPPPHNPQVRPLPGTPERKLFDKIADRCGLGAAAAHAELRRGANGPAATPR